MWPTSVTRQSLQAADLIGEHCGKVAALVQKCAAQQKRPRWQRRRNRCCGHNTSRHGWSDSKPAQAMVADMPEQHRPLLVQFAGKLLQMHSKWLDSTLLRSHSFVRGSFPGASSDDRTAFAWKAMILLQKAQLAFTAVSTNPTGPKRVFSVRRMRAPAAVWDALSCN